MQVKTTISDSRQKIISDSEADVFIRVIPEGYSSSVIYTVYNTTSGADYCSKFVSSNLVIASNIPSSCGMPYMHIQLNGMHH